MPTTSSLKGARTREKKLLLKEESEAGKILLTNYNTDDATEVGHHLLVVGKVLVSLETKLARLESANDNLIEAYEQSNDNKGAEQFQRVLDEECDLLGSIIDKISQLKVLKEELERRRRESDGRNRRSEETRASDQVRTEQSGEIGSGLAPHTYGPIKPRQLEIAPFTGDVLKWKEFWDAFEASIDKFKYAPIDKFNYLKSKLRGEALEAISGYQLSNDNYAAVVEVLKKRFGNPQLIIDAHYRNLSHVPPASNHVPKLRQCYDTIERHLRSLEAVGENANHRHFVSLILDKLPQRVRCQVYMQKPDDQEWTTSSLRHLLGKYISAMEMAGGDSHDSLGPSSNPGRVPLRPRPTQHRSAEGLLAASNRQSTQVKCVYYGQTHWSDECPHYQTLQSRRDKLKGC